MSDDPNGTPHPATDLFVWHPEYTGRSVESVRRDLADDIRRDQSAYHLALENAEKEEFGAFNSVRELEKRWSEFDFGWFDVPAETLATRIVAFERERENQQVMISWHDWRSSSSSTLQEASPVSEEKRDWRENLSDEQRKRIASAMSIGIILLMVLICIGLYALVR